MSTGLGTGLGTGLAVGRWRLVEPARAGFAVRNLGFLTVRGSFPVRTAWFEVDAQGRPTRVHVALDVAGVETGNRRRDEDLCARRLLDAAGHPTMTFTGGPADRVGDGSWDLPGRLAGHGRSTELTLRVETTPTGVDRLAVRATGTLDRRRLGVTAPRFLIDTRIGIEVDAEFEVPAAG